MKRPVAGAGRDRVASGPDNTALTRRIRPGFIFLLLAVPLQAMALFVNIATAR